MKQSLFNIFSKSLMSLALLISIPGCSRANISDNPEVEKFINEMVQIHHFDHDQLKDVLNHAEIRQDILDIIARPAERKPWYQYHPIFVTDARAEEGARFWHDNAEYLKRAEITYGVPAPIIIAIIGVETRYGRNTGSYSVLDALTTLAFNDPKRPTFFKNELAEFLLLTREEKVDPRSWKGSYAGAMGKPQFISSSYRKFAIDFSGHGHRDLFNNDGDAIGSVANYFKEFGWKSGEAVIYPVTAKGEDYKKLVNDLTLNHSIADLKKSGVIIPENKDLKDSMPAVLISLQESENQEGLWIGLNNFYVITRYNRSPLYSMAVYQLAKKIQDLHNAEAAR